MNEKKNKQQLLTCPSLKNDENENPKNSNNFQCDDVRRGRKRNQKLIKKKTMGYHSSSITRKRKHIQISNQYFRLFLKLILAVDGSKSKTITGQNCGQSLSSQTFHLFGILAFEPYFLTILCCFNFLLSSIN